MHRVTKIEITFYLARGAAVIVICSRILICGWLTDSVHCIAITGEMKDQVGREMKDQLGRELTLSSENQVWVREKPACGG